MNSVELWCVVYTKSAKKTIQHLYGRQYTSYWVKKL